MVVLAIAVELVSVILLRVWEPGMNDEEIREAWRGTAEAAKRVMMEEWGVDAVTKDVEELNLDWLEVAMDAGDYDAQYNMLETRRKKATKKYARTVDEITNRQNRLAQAKAIHDYLAPNHPRILRRRMESTRQPCSSQRTRQYPHCV